MDYIIGLYEIAASGSLYWFCAVSGSLMFLIQMLLSFFDGMDYDDIDVGDDRLFKRLSIQAIAGFLMMFGLVGITCQKDFELSKGSTIMIAVAAGLATIFITNSIFKIAKKLQSSGSVFKIEDAIGKEAYVYQRISKGGVGKVTISLQQGSFEVDAVSNSQEELPSFTRVQIIKKIDDNTVVVTTI